MEENENIVINKKNESDDYYKKVGIMIILLTISFISSNITTMFLKIYSEEIQRFFTLVGDGYFMTTIIAITMLILGANYYLKNRLTTGKEDFKLMGKSFICLLPIIYISSPGSIESIVSNEVLWFSITYTVISTVSFLLLYSQLIKLIKNLMKILLEIVTEPHDRLSVAITITGVVISLIALLK